MSQQINFNLPGNLSDKVVEIQAAIDDYCRETGAKRYAVLIAMFDAWQGQLERGSLDSDRARKIDEIHAILLRGGTVQDTTGSYETSPQYYDNRAEVLNDLLGD